MILVPEITIAGFKIGPVWFTRRQDSNFTEWMSQWMDTTIQGAVGGSALQYFSSIYLDYPKERAWFRL